MKLSELFAQAQVFPTGSLPQGECYGITADSRRVRAGDVFVATVGDTVDSHRFAAAALEKGAVLAVTERPLGLASEVQVPNGKEAYALLAQAFYGWPARSMTLAAATGTNGKSTVAAVLKQILDGTGHKTALFGTMYNELGDVRIPAKYTTPEAGDLAAMLRTSQDLGCTHAVMEASSQALAQKRLFGLRFAVGIFTNLSRDHLDYHKTMENYFEAKRTLFTQCDAAVVNIDDPYGRRLAKTLQTPLLTYSESDPSASLFAKDLQLLPGGVSFRLVYEGNEYPVRFPMPGRYSCQNAMAAAGAAITLGVEVAKAAKALSSIRGVRGRCEVLYSGDFTVIRDFAHTEDALRNLLAGLAPQTQNRMLVLFGCAGERDESKRGGMAQAVVEYADAIVLSADNPRRESVQHSFEAAEAVLRQSPVPYVAIEDRRQGVLHLLEEAKRGDLVVLCGKGHEDYQVLDGVTVFLDEEDVVTEWLIQEGRR